MAWRVAHSLDQLLAQLNALAPNRSRASDGSIGDAAHQADGDASDHNPWFVLGGQALVTARDFTDDQAAGLDCNKLATALIASRDPRIKYLIWQGRICDSRPEFAPWTWQPSSGHYHHLHLSVMANASADDPRPWSLPGLNSEEDDMPSADEIVEALMGRLIDVVDGSNPDGSLKTHRVPFKDVIRFSELFHLIARGKLDRLEAKLEAIAQALGDDEAKILAAIRAVPAGVGGGATPEQMEVALRRVFADAGEASDTTT